LVGNEIFEKLGAIGTLSNLLVYLTTVFNLENIMATNIINIFNGSTNFATLLGAFLSDAFFGRYKILAFCTMASFVVNFCCLQHSIPFYLFMKNTTQLGISEFRKTQ